MRDHYDYISIFYIIFHYIWLVYILYNVHNKALSTLYKHSKLFLLLQIPEDYIYFMLLSAAAYGLVSTFQNSQRVLNNRRRTSIHALQENRLQLLETWISKFRILCH